MPPPLAHAYRAHENNPIIQRMSVMQKWLKANGFIEKNKWPMLSRCEPAGLSCLERYAGKVR